MKRDSCWFFYNFQNSKEMTVQRRFNKLTSVFHVSGPVMDHEFRYNIVK